MTSGTVDRAPFTIYFETEGPDEAPPLVLIAGLGEQIGSVEFPGEQRRQLLEAGFRLVRIDNRDAGLSVPTPELAVPDLEAIRAGTVAPPYHHRDMAADVVTVLDALGVERAHLMGASMGGFIVRWIAIDFPERVDSLTVVMSGSGATPEDEGLQNDLTVLGRLFGMAQRHSKPEAIESMTESWRWMWGSGYPFEQDWVRERVEYAYDRGYRPEGIFRQLVAVASTESLWLRQREIDCPTLVLHGGADPLWGCNHADGTASQIPRAELWLDPRMGHIMHREQWAELAERAAALAARAS